jgi:hypothetical protein
MLIATFSVNRLVTMEIPGAMQYLLIKANMVLQKASCFLSGRIDFTQVNIENTPAIFAQMGSME